MPPEEVAKLEGRRVKFEGVVKGKPVVEVFGTGWPWSIETYVEKNHAHRTIIKISGVTVVFPGIALFKAGERVVVYGMVKGGEVEALTLESEQAVFLRR